MQRYLALDIGTKRIGIAISDPLLLTAQPLKFIERNPEDKAINEISEIVKDNVTKIIIGLPKNMDGSIGFQAKDTQEFAQKLDKLNIEICFEDERLTSKQAENALKLIGKKYTKNKGLVDVTSAIIILQQHLDRR